MSFTQVFFEMPAPSLAEHDKITHAFQEDLQHPRMLAGKLTHLHLPHSSLGKGGKTLSTNGCLVTAYRMQPSHEFFDVISRDDPQHWIPTEKARKLTNEITEREKSNQGDE